MKENLYDELYTEQEEQVDYKALFFKYLIHWKWFVASIVVCLIGGWIYLHYTTPVYSITGSVIIKDNKKKQQCQHRTGRFGRSRFLLVYQQLRQ